MLPLVNRDRLLLQTASIGPTIGVSGLAATIMEFIYVVTNRDNFTNFEEVFFLTAGSFEMLGDFASVAGALYIASKDGFSSEIYLRHE